MSVKTTRALRPIPSTPSTPPAAPLLRLHPSAIRGALREALTLLLPLSHTLPPRHLQGTDAAIDALIALIALIAPIAPIDLQGTDAAIDGVKGFMGNTLQVLTFGAIGGGDSSSSGGDSKKRGAQRVVAPSIAGSDPWPSLPNTPQNTRRAAPEAQASGEAGFKSVVAEIDELELEIAQGGRRPSALEVRAANQRRRASQLLYTVTYRYIPLPTRCALPTRGEGRRSWRRRRSSRRRLSPCRSRSESRVRQ